MNSAHTPHPSADREGEVSAAHAAMDLLGQKWSMRVVWELEAGQLGFLELRRRLNNCSSSMLAERLRQLQEARLVEKNAARTYELTELGVALGEALKPLWRWSAVWAD